MSVDHQMLLLSIRPEFSQAIFSGAKEVEFRRRAPRRATHGSQLVIYASSPTRALVGVATISEIVEATPTALWRRFRTVGGIEYQAFSSYYSGTDSAVAIVLSNVRCFKNPPSLVELRRSWGHFQPPQQYAYLCNDRIRKVRRLKLASAVG